MLKTKEETKEPKLRAVFDGRCLPIELFGSGPNAPHKRKLIWNYIATYANPDGTSAFPGRNTIAAHNGVTPSTVTKITKWLEQHHLLKVEYKASRHNTNCYSVLFSEEAQDACRAQLAETQGELRDKAEQNHRARSTAAKSRWAKQNADREYSIPCVELAHSEYSIPRAADSTGNTAFPIDGESFASDRESFAWDRECSIPLTVL